MNHHNTKNIIFILQVTFCLLIFMQSCGVPCNTGEDNPNKFCNNLNENWCCACSGTLCGKRCIGGCTWICLPDNGQCWGTRKVCASEDVATKTTSTTSSP